MFRWLREVFAKPDSPQVRNTQDADKTDEIFGAGALFEATLSGMREGRLTQESYAKKIYSRTIGGKLYSAIQVTTAAGICAMVDMMRDGTLPARGFVRQEEAELDKFLGNRFGQYYA